MSAIACIYSSSHSESEATPKAMKITDTDGGTTGRSDVSVEAHRLMEIGGWRRRACVGLGGVSLVREKG